MSMASLALYLKSHHHKTPHTILKSAPRTLTFSHLFSSSSSDGNGGESPKPSDLSSRFADIKSRLKQQEQLQNQQNQSTGFRPFKFTPQQGSSTPPKNASLEEIRKNLSEFRLRSSVPAPESSSQPGSQQQPTLLQDLYKKNISVSNPNPNANMQQGGPSFEAIQESLRQLKDKGAKAKTGSQPFSLSHYRDNFKIRPSMPEGGTKVYGGSIEGLPISVFGKEMNERDKKKKGGKGNDSLEDELAKSELIRAYSHPELGEKLRELRPHTGKNEDGDKDSGFSLAELNERLKKLREIDENKEVGTRAGFSHGELRRGIRQILLSRDANSRKPDFPRIDILGQMNGTRAPKEHLVEKYFHPDNMSSEEKLKLELKKVRDEFKMHESDCGSARVQIAQLTTEISHLSSVLHKKDKHSRKGLLGKVQQRKKLLKYLRRTDWDSYCFVLSKLGLRDNPDYKH